MFDLPITHISSTNSDVISFNSFFFFVVLLLVLVANICVDEGVLGEHKEMWVPLPVDAVLQIQDSIFDGVSEIHVTHCDENI